MTTVPTVELNNGVKMPQIGLGVFQSSPEDTVKAVKAALETGYRHIDTAAAYGNERQVGEAIAASGLNRDEVFVETKVWVSDYGYDETLHAFDKASKKLGTDYIDLLILHQSMPHYFDKTVQAYKGLETLLADGKVRAIGVSNFMPKAVEDLLSQTEIVPAVNQIECHPYFSQPAVQKIDADNGILTQAWSPIGGITFYPGWGDQRRSVMDDPTLQKIAADHGKSAAQIMLAWHIAEGRSAIPKSVNPERIAQNFDVFDIELSADELSAIDALDTGVRNGPDPEADNAGFFGMNIPEA